MAVSRIHDKILSILCLQSNRSSPGSFHRSFATANPPVSTLTQGDLTPHVATCHLGVLVFKVKIFVEKTSLILLNPYFTHLAKAKPRKAPWLSSW